MKPICEITLTPLQLVELLRKMNVEMVKDGGLNLTALQLAVLLTVYLDDNIHTVRGVAEAQSVSRAAIYRGLLTLVNRGLIERVTKRGNTLMQRTDKGKELTGTIIDTVVKMASCNCQNSDPH